MWRGSGPVCWRRAYIGTCTTLCSVSFLGLLGISCFWLMFLSAEGGPDRGMFGHSSVLTLRMILSFLFFFFIHLFLLVCLTGSVQKPVSFALVKTVKKLPCFALRVSGTLDCFCLFSLFWQQPLSGLVKRVFH